MLAVIGFMIHLAAIYTGALTAQLEYIDIWRCALVSCLSYLVMLLFSLLLLPLLVLAVYAGGADLLHSKVVVVPLNTMIVGVAAAVTAKIVFSTDWQPAWTIGGFAGVANALWTMLSYAPARH